MSLNIRVSDAFTGCTRLEHGIAANDFFGAGNRA